MKVIFLDVDGVLNNETTKAVAPSGYMGVMDSKVKLLKKIVDATGAKVVLSSDWRICDRNHDKDFKYLLNKLKYKGNIAIYDFTPDLSVFDRGHEIRDWIKRNQTTKEYVVLDDIEFPDFYDGDFFNHVIITDYEIGLSQDDVDQAINILNGGENNNGDF